MDEMPWSVNGRTTYLWVAAAPIEAIYHVGPTRAHSGAFELLDPTPKGYLVHDRFSAYETVGTKTGLHHQACWVHLLGDSKELAKFVGADREQIHGILKAVYRAAERVAGRGKEPDVRPSVEAVEHALKSLLRRPGFVGRHAPTLSRADVVRRLRLRSPLTPRAAARAGLTRVVVQIYRGTGHPFRRLPLHIPQPRLRYPTPPPLRVAQGRDRAIHAR